MMKNTKNKGKVPFQMVAETLTKKAPKNSLRLQAIMMAAAALCAAGCDDSAGGYEETTQVKTVQPVLRFQTLPDGTQTVKEEEVQSDLPDPVARSVEKDQKGQRWIKIYHDPVPFADGSKDTTGLLREYAYVNLENSQAMSQQRFENSGLKLQGTKDQVFWHAVSPYAFDGFWSDKAELNKGSAMDIHANALKSFAAGGMQDDGKIHGASGDWSSDSTQTKPVETRSGGHGHYVCMPRYYPYAYHNYGSSPIAGAGSHGVSEHNSLHSSGKTKPFTHTNVFRTAGAHMTAKPALNRSFHVTTVRTPVVRGGFSSRGFSFSA